MFRHSADKKQSKNKTKENNPFHAQKSSQSSNIAVIATSGLLLNAGEMLDTGYQQCSSILRNLCSTSEKLISNDTEESRQF